MQNIKRIVLLSLMLMCSALAYAEQKKVFDGPDGTEYDVHYIALSSTFLEPDVARSYGLTRSKALGLLNISVIQRFPDGRTKPVGAVIEANAKNDIQQVRHLNMNQIVEGEAIYYIAQVQFREGEILTFDISVYPQGVIDPLKLRFAHTFFNE